MNPKGLLAAASITSQTSTPNRSHMIASSFTSPMLIIRKVFSSSLAISAASAVLTRTTVCSAWAYQAAATSEQKHGSDQMVSAMQNIGETTRQNVRGIPTIVEANTPLYRWGSRVSIYTGLPTVIGWDWHQKQQRSVLPGQLIDQRIADVRTIYNSIDVNEAVQLLQQYHVGYIYVGRLERLYYDPAGLGKFTVPNPAWSLVYQNDQVQIYQVH